MILATDTHYTNSIARTAGVVFNDWTDTEPISTHVIENTGVAEYEPGSFYKRELPLILALLEVVELAPHTIIIDGYVHLDSDGRKGLGAHLHEALDKRVTVIGVAKKTFKGSPHAVSVYRGESQRALYVTAEGILPEEAARHIVSMNGEYRHPTLLRLADRLSREGGQR